jgi:ribosomal protein S18 acetylase RimI-like enzyme
VIVLRLAKPADLAVVLPRTRALNAHEHIVVTDEVLDAALCVLLGEPTLGGVWLIVENGTIIGYALVTYCFDLEFGGREAWMTELWIDAPARGHGAATTALQLLETELRARGVGALHLQVRPENPAVRLYDRMGFARSPRWVMTRRL